MVTGTSSGVGQACAKLLARKGYGVLACVRREEDGLKLKHHSPELIHPVIVELQNQNTIEQAAQTAKELSAGNGVKCLVNCAGNLYCGPLEYFPREFWFPQYDVNLFGTMALTRAILPLIRRASGRIITIGVVGGGVALPFYGSIASSKIALQAANDCLRRELHPWGIHVVVIEPGGINTPANDKMRRSVHEFLNTIDSEGFERYAGPMNDFSSWAHKMHQKSLEPEKVALKVLKVIETRHPKPRYRMGWDSRGMALLAWLLPDRLFDIVLLKVASLPWRFGAWQHLGGKL